MELKLNNFLNYNLWLRAILDFYWLGVKLAIWLSALLLATTYVLGTQMGHENPFYTSKF
jgi:hypothetical protein